MLSAVRKVIKGSQYLWTVYQGYHKQIFIVAFLGFASAFFGGIGISVVIPLFALLTPQPAGPLDSITRSIHKFFSVLHIPITVPYLLAGIVVLFTAKALVTFWAKYYNDKVAARFEKSARTKLFRATLTSTWPNLLEYKLGFLDRVISYDVQQSGSLLNSATATILTLTTLITYIVIAMNISVIATVAMIIFGAVIFLVLKPFFYKTRKLSMAIEETFKSMAHHINQAMIAMKIIKTSSTEERIGEEGEIYFENVKKIRVKSAFYAYALGASLEPLGFVFIAVLFLITYRTASFNIASFAVAVYLVQRIFSLIQSMQAQMQAVNQLVPYVQSVYDHQRKADLHQEADHGTLPFAFEHTLSLQNIAFSYPSAAISALSLDSLHITKGMVLGIIGPSGSGKTTIADMLLRLMEPQEGTIRLDDHDIRDIKLKEWRRNVGYVPQEVFLLNDTIENNIKFYQTDMTHEEVVAAAKMANIVDTIEKLPLGFATQVGERGLKLSGGQRQRIALARTLARAPRILILDEATSALDNESEASIQEAISNLRGNVTVIIIAHHINTIMKTDTTIILENGRIIESGQPEELLQNKNSYLHKVYHI